MLNTKAILSMLRALSFLLILPPFLLTLSAKNIDIDTILQKSNESNRTLFIFLHRTGCSYCNAMNEFTLDDEAIKSYLSKYFTLLSINITDGDAVRFKEFNGTAQEFAQYIGYDIYPSSLFLSKSGCIDVAKVGYKDENYFLLLLKYVNERAFESLDFKSYLSGKRPLKP